MTLAKKIIKYCLYAASAVVLLFIIEGIYFYRVIQKEPSLTNADAIVVFNGFRERVEAGYNLAGRGYAPNLVVTQADSYHLANYRRRYGLPDTVTVVKEDKARTTFENAFYAGKIIKDRQFRSIILVTSLYHLPRSLFLCKAQLLGQNVKVQVYSPPADRGKLWISSGGRKLIHREMVRFWGSLSELLYCKAAGGVPQKSLSDLKLVKQIRALFSI
ncbi:MAG: YdcF family protein [Thermodesulfobacteriota bacterium]